MRVNEAMCVESTANKEGRKGSVRNVSFVNAQVKVVNCTVNNLSVDISQISVGPLASVALFESIDRLVGRNHVFKRSVVLIKAWLKHEAQRWALKESAQELGNKRRRMKRWRMGDSNADMSGMVSDKVGGAVGDAASGGSGVGANKNTLMGARDGGLSSSAVTVLVASLFFCCMTPPQKSSLPGVKGERDGEGKTVLKLAGTMTMTIVPRPLSPYTTLWTRWYYFSECTLTWTGRSIA